MVLVPSVPGRATFQAKLGFVSIAGCTRLGYYALKKLILLRYGCAAELEFMNRPIK